MTTTTELYARVRLEQIVPSLTNPRKTFDQAKLAELAESIRATGVHQPVLLRPLPGERVAETANMDPRPEYELVVGERRYRASEMAGRTVIPAVVRALTDDEVLEIQIVENLQRDDLAPLEEAEGYQSLMQRHDPPMTADQVAERIGKSRSYVYARLKLLDLGPEGRQALMEGKLDASRALLIARIPDTKLQASAVGNATDYAGTPVSYRALRDLIERQYMQRLDRAKFKITDANLLPEAGSCRACPKRTGANPDIFSDVNGADVCTDPPCFARKEQAHTDAQLKAAREKGANIIEGREAKAIMPNSWGALEGYLRLDEAMDSPTGKPLRSVIGKQLEKAGIAPTLVANPHKDGELIAVVPHETAREMLAAKGLGDQAEKLAERAKQSVKAAAEQEKKKATEKFETEWRLRLMATTWKTITELDETAMVLNDQVLRHLAMRQVQNLNQDRAKRICKILDLGKVAPVEAVKDWVRDCPDPERALALVVMNSEVEYEPWRSDPAEENKALMLMATDLGVDVAAVKAEVKKEHTAALRAAAKKAKEAAPPADAPEASAPLPSAARAKGGRGGGKAQSAPPAARAKKPRTSEKEARTGIAAAMQGEEAGADTGPGEADPAGSAGEQEQRPTTAAGDGQQDDVCPWPFPKQRY